jgi:hypothetical protein
MRKLFHLVAAILLLYPAISYTQHPALPTEGKVAEPKAGATVGDYKKIINLASRWSKNLTNVKYYETRYTFKEKKTGEIKKLSELPAFDRDMFFMLQCELITKNLTTTNDKWKTDADALPSADKEEEEEEDKTPAKKEDVQQFLGQLLVIRKTAAEKYEALAEKVFKDYADKFTTEERDQYLKSMRDRHDKDKLIERKK